MRIPTLNIIRVALWHATHDTPAILNARNVATQLLRTRTTRTPILARRFAGVTSERNPPARPFRLTLETNSATPRFHPPRSILPSSRVRFQVFARRRRTSRSFCGTVFAIQLSDPQLASLSFGWHHCSRSPPPSSTPPPNPAVADPFVEPP